MDPFEEAFNWLNEEEEDVTDEALDLFLKKGLGLWWEFFVRIQIVAWLISQRTIRPVTKSSSALSCRCTVHVIEDPKGFVCRREQEALDVEQDELWLKRQ